MVGNLDSGIEEYELTLIFSTQDTGKSSSAKAIPRWDTPPSDDVYVCNILIIQLQLYNQFNWLLHLSILITNNNFCYFLIQLKLHSLFNVLLQSKPITK